MPCTGLMRRPRSQRAYLAPAPGISGRPHRLILSVGVPHSRSLETTHQQVQVVSLTFPLYTIGLWEALNSMMSRWRRSTVLRSAAGGDAGHVQFLRTAYEPLSV